MQRYVDSQIADLLRLVRQPGVRLVFAGFTVALAFFTVSNQFPEIRTDQGPLPLAFWSGEALMLVGLIRFAIHTVQRLLPPSRPKSTDASAEGPARA